MAIKEQRKFKTSDGREFDDEKEAERHDELILIREEYKSVLRRMNTLIAETTRTADGKLFEFGLWKTYYYVTEGFFQMPQLTEVPYLGWNWHLNERDDAVEIILYEGNDKRTREFKINNLYAGKHNALIALVAAQRAWLREREEQIAEVAKKVEAGIDPTRS